LLAHRPWKHGEEIKPDIAAIFDPFGNVFTRFFLFPCLATAVANHAGAHHVVLLDVNPYRLELAARVGMTIAIDPRKTSLPEVQQQLGMREEFDVDLESCSRTPGTTAVSAVCKASRVNEIS
jgi:threonine 3-dehydrogenase